MKIKLFFESLRKKNVYIRYSIIVSLNIIFFGLMSFPFYRNEEPGAAWKFIIALSVFVFSLVYGFLSVEITDNCTVGSLMLVLFGGLWAAFSAYGMIPTEKGNLLYCLYYFIKYGIASFFVGLVIKNTRR